MIGLIKSVSDQLECSLCISWFIAFLIESSALSFYTFDRPLDMESPSVTPPALDFGVVDFTLLETVAPP